MLKETSPVEEIEADVSDALNHDHWNGEIIETSTYFHDEDGADIVFEIQGEFANIGRALSAVRSRSDCTVEHVALARDGGVEADHVLHLGLEYFANRPEGSMFTEDMKLD